MPLSPLAGQPAPAGVQDSEKLQREYYEIEADPADPR